MSGRRAIRSPTPSANGKPKLDRWSTLNAFTDEMLAPLTKETGSSAAGSVWYVCFRLADGNTGLLTGASVRRLAKLTGLTFPTVRLAIENLTKKRLLTVEKKADGKRQQVTVYRVYHLEKELDDG